MHVHKSFVVSLPVLLSFAIDRMAGTGADPKVVEDAAAEAPDPIDEGVEQMDAQDLLELFGQDDGEVEYSVGEMVDGDDAAAESAMCEPCGGEDKNDNGEILCFICGVGVALVPKNRYGKCCQALITAARRDSRQQGPEAQKAFSRLQKIGTDEFRTAIQEYRSRCFSHKGFRRPQFAWLRYLMIIELSSAIDIGSKSVWLNEHAFIKFMGESEGMSVAAARQKWIIEKQRMTAGQQRKNADGKDQLLWPIEDFVMNYNTRKVREECQLGGKAKCLSCMLCVCVICLNDSLLRTCETLLTRQWHKSRATWELTMKHSVDQDGRMHWGFVKTCSVDWVTGSSANHPTVI